MSLHLTKYSIYLDAEEEDQEDDEDEEDDD